MQAKTLRRLKSDSDQGKNAGSKNPVDGSLDQDDITLAYRQQRRSKQQRTQQQRSAKMYKAQKRKHRRRRATRHN